MSPVFASIQNFDIATNFFIASSIRSAALTPGMILATELGRTVPMTILVLLVAAVLLSKKLKNDAYFILIVSLGASATTVWLKTVFMRPRPELALLSEPSFSFPSGHATAAVAVLGSIALVLYRRSNSKSLRLLIPTLALLVILLLSFSRLYLGAHYLSDVVAGWVVGGVWLFLGVFIFKNRFVSKQFVTIL